MMYAYYRCYIYNPILLSRLADTGREGKAAEGSEGKLARDRGNKKKQKQLIMHEGRQSLLMFYTMKGIKTQIVQKEEKKLRLAKGTDRD